MASSEIGQLIYRIIGDNSSIKKTIGETENKVKGLGDTFKKVGLAIAAAFSVNAIVDFYKKTVQSASAAEEENQKFGVVFSRVFSEASKSAKDLADNYGLSETAAKKFLSTNANIFESLGLTQKASLGLSEKVIKLGTDLVSFTNFSGGTEEGINAISKALIGEREQLKSLGIAVLEEDLVNFAQASGKVYASMSKQEKATLTLAYITKLADNAVGDFGRSCDSWANVQRRVTAATDDSMVSIGQKLIPGLSELGIEYIRATKSGGFVQKSLEGIAGAANSVISGLAALMRDQNNITESESKTQSAYKDTSDQLDSVLSSAEKYGAQLARNAGQNGTTQQAVAAFDKALASGDTTAIAYQKSIDKLNDSLNTLREKANTGATPIYNLFSANNALLAKIKETGEEIKKQDYNIEKAREAHQWRVSHFEAEIKLAEAQGETEKAIRLKALKDIEDVNAKEKMARADKAKAIKAIEMKMEQDIQNDKLNKLNQYVSFAVTNATNLLNALSSLNSQLTKNRIEELDAQMEAELEAAGVAEDTAVEKAQKELDTATAAGDATTIAEKKKALTKAKIEEEYQRKKAKTEYEGNLASWEIQFAMATMQALQAPLSAYASTAAIPVIGAALAPIAAALAAATAGVMLATVASSKPSPPKFETGGIVPGTSFSGDNVSIQANSGEAVLTARQQRNFMDIVNGKISSGLSRVTNLTWEGSFKEIFEATRDGRLFIAQRAIQSI
jgi:hypothetical protein